MKKALHAILKLLLVLTIFLGLQGRVLVRYAEIILHKNHKNELVNSGTAKVKAGIIHCKLQCYTQHFRVLDIPFVAFFVSLIILLTASLIIDQVYIPFKEKFSLADPVRLLPLRGPPAF
jgi:hypothetical protein